MPGCDHLLSLYQRWLHPRDHSYEERTSRNLSDALNRRSECNRKQRAAVVAKMCLAHLTFLFDPTEPSRLEMRGWTLRNHLNGHLLKYSTSNLWYLKLI